MQEIVASACRSLTSVYLGQAESLADNGHVDKALEAYNKCLNAAELAHDVSVAARAHFQVGMLYYQHHNWMVSYQVL
jgi:hypothetical protein